MGTSRSLGRFMEWLYERAAALAMQVEPCTLGALAPQWVVDAQSVRRPDGAFFTIDGVNVTRAAGREVSGWKQPLIANETQGFVALIRSDRQQRGGRDGYLVRVKAEPGNRGIEICGLQTRVLVAPPVQFSKGNLAHHERALRGELDGNDKPIKRVPFASAALSELPSWARTAHWENAPEDGGRFYEKVNRYGRISVTSASHLADELALTGVPEDFTWVDLTTLREIRRQGLANGHLRSVMSLLV